MALLWGHSMNGTETADMAEWTHGQGTPPITCLKWTPTITWTPVQVTIPSALGDTQVARKDRPEELEIQA